MIKIVYIVLYSHQINSHPINNNNNNNHNNNNNNNNHNNNNNNNNNHNNNNNNNNNHNNNNNNNIIIALVIFPSSKATSGKQFCTADASVEMGISRPAGSMPMGVPREMDGLFQ